MINIALLTLMAFVPVYALDVIITESFNAKDDLASFEYNAKVITAKDVANIVLPGDTRNVVGSNWIALSMTKKTDIGRHILQFTCRVEGEGKNEVATVLLGYPEINEISTAMVQTRILKVDRIVITGCIVK